MQIKKRIIFSGVWTACYYLVVLLLQLGGLLLVWLLVLCSFAVPHLTQFLGRVANRESGILTLHLGAEFSAEEEECGPEGQHVRFFMLGCACCVAKTHFIVIISDIRRSLRGIGVLESLLLVAFRGHVVLHFPLVAHLVLFRHVFKFAFLFWGHRLVARGEIQRTRVMQYNW